MKGRLWVMLGIALGIAVGIGKVPYLAGAAKSYADTAEHLVGTGARSLIHAAAARGAPRRVVEGAGAVVGVVVPGLSALLLVAAARATLFVRRVIAVLLGAVGVAGFFYLPAGHAIGVGVLALAAAGLAVAASGPLVAAPLAGLAALIAVAYLPQLIGQAKQLADMPVSSLHHALFATAGTPLWLQALLLIVAAVPFAIAARAAIR